MEQGKETFIAQRFQRLSNLFYLMVGLPLLCFGWVYLNLQGLSTPALFDHPVYAWFWHVPAVLLIVGLTAGAYILYRGRLKNYFSAAGKEPSLQRLENRVEVFYELSLRKYLMLTVAVLLAVLSLYLSGHKGYAAIYGILLLIFSVSRPTARGLNRDLKLNKEERLIVHEALKQLR
ncbi:hypothetical protein [Nafulsella turpanensis]|uniref:hypothetical protein n=1 Tax=Nafulsella turpanensis TaxID=1265690 RepID=UPI00034A1F1D|nr:hypothetical protein [Nafulsella turpanensis]